MFNLKLLKKIIILTALGSINFSSFIFSTDIDEKSDSEQINNLLSAMGSGDVELVKALINKNPKLVNAREILKDSEFGDTPILTLAAFKTLNDMKRALILGFLIDNGADVTTTGRDHQENILHKAAYNSEKAFDTITATLKLKNLEGKISDDTLAKLFKGKDQWDKTPIEALRFTKHQSKEAKKAQDTY